MDVERRRTAVGGADVHSGGRALARPGERVSLEPKPDRTVGGDDVALSAGQRGVEDRDSLDRAGTSRVTTSYDDVRRRCPSNRDLVERRLVPEDRNAGHVPCGRHDDVDPADRHADRRRLTQIRMRQKEDGVRADRAWRTRQPHLAEPERDDARSVGGDGRVVARQPKPARRVALSIRQLREEDVSAGVEPCLEPRSVVTCVGARGRSRRREHERHQRGERQISPTTHENPRAAEYLQVRVARRASISNTNPTVVAICARHTAKPVATPSANPARITCA